jgi:hypothetical protein
MIVIKVEMWPRGVESRKREIGSLRIANDGTGTREIGNYTYDLRGAKERTMGEGRVMGFARLREHVWDLITRVLEHAGRG